MSGKSVVEEKQYSWQLLGTPCYLLAESETIPGNNYVIQLILQIPVPYVEA